MNEDSGTAACAARVPDEAPSMTPVIAPTDESKTRVYLVRQKADGFVIEGPGRHIWQCRGDDWTRCTAFAQALERAYIEGQKSIKSNVELYTVLSTIAMLTSAAVRVLIKDGKLDDLIAQAKQLSDMLRTALGQNRLNRSYNP